MSLLPVVVLPKNLDEKEVLHLSGMVTKTPAYVDYIGYPYAESTSTRVDDFITSFDSTEDGYFYKSNQTWVFQAFSSLTTDDLSDVSLDSAGTDGTPDSPDDAIYSKAILSYDSTARKWEWHHASSQDTDWFDITVGGNDTVDKDDPEAFWANTDPENHSFGLDGFSPHTEFHVFFGTGFGTTPASTLDIGGYWEGDENSPSAVWVQKFAQAKPSWSSETFPNVSKDTQEWKAMKPQEMKARPISAWEDFSFAGGSSRAPKRVFTKGHWRFKGSGATGLGHDTSPSSKTDWDNISAISVWLSLGIDTPGTYLQDWEGFGSKDYFTKITALWESIMEPTTMRWYGYFAQSVGTNAGWDYYHDRPSIYLKNPEDFTLSAPGYYTSDSFPKTVNFWPENIGRRLSNLDTYIKRCDHEGFTFDETTGKEDDIFSQRLVGGAARTKLDLVVPSVASVFSNYYSASEYAFEEVTRRLDLLHEVAEHSHGMDFGRLGWHTRKTPKYKNYEPFPVDSSVETHLSLDDLESRNYITPYNGSLLSTNFDITEARSRGLLKKYNERSFGGWEPSYFIKTPEIWDDTGKEYAHGENWHTKRWVSNPQSPVNPFPKYHKWLSDMTFQDTHNIVNNVGSWAIKKDMTAVFGSNINEIYVNWRRPFAFPELFREGELPNGLARYDYYPVSVTTNSGTTSGEDTHFFSGDRNWIHSQRARDYISLTIVFENPLPVEDYAIVAFPNTPYERELPDPQTDWEDVCSSNFTGKDGWPVDNTISEGYFNRWGYPLYVRDYYYDNGYPTSSISWRLSDQVALRNLSYSDFQNIDVLATGYDWYGPEYFDQPQNGKPVWVAGPLLNSVYTAEIKRYNTTYLAFTYPRLVACLPDFSDCDPVITHHDVVGGGDWRVCRTGFAGTQGWDYTDSNINNVPFSHSYWRDSSDSPGVDTWTDRIAREPFLTMNGDTSFRREDNEDLNTTYFDTTISLSGTTTHAGNTIKQARGQYTRVLYRDKTSCTILVPADWWDRSKHLDAVDFSIRLLRRTSSYAKGICHPDLVQEDYSSPIYDWWQVPYTSKWSGNYSRYGTRFTPEAYPLISKHGYVSVFNPTILPDYKRNGDFHIGSRIGDPPVSSVFFNSAYTHHWISMQNIVDQCPSFIRPFSNWKTDFDTPVFIGEEKYLWYDESVYDFWKPLGQYSSFKTPTEDLLDIIKQVVPFTSNDTRVGMPDFTANDVSSAATVSKGTPIRCIPFLSKADVSVGDDAYVAYMPSYGYVTSITFEHDVRFVPKNSYDHTSPSGPDDAPTGRELVLFVAGTDAGLGGSFGIQSINFNTLYGASNATVAKVTGFIDSDSTDPTDWVITKGTTVTLPYPVPLAFDNTYEDSSGDPIEPNPALYQPYVGIALCTPDISHIDGSGNPIAAFEVDINYLPNLYTGGGYSGTSNSSHNISPDTSYSDIMTQSRESNSTTSAVFVKLGFQNIFGEAETLEVPSDIYGPAGEGWGYISNKFGGPGTPQWEGQDVDPWLDPEGLLDLDDNLNSGFGDPNNV